MSVFSAWGNCFSEQVDFCPAGTVIHFVQNLPRAKNSTNEKVHISLTWKKRILIGSLRNHIHSEKLENNLRFIESAEKVMLTKDYAAKGKNSVLCSVQAGQTGWKA